jgi:hypothetical protein
MIPVAVASLAAIAIQPLILGVWLGVPMYLAGESVPPREAIGMAGLVSIVAAVFVLAIGVPSFLILRHRNRATAVALGAVGFLVAALPFAALGWPGNSFPGFFIRRQLARWARRVCCERGGHGLRVAKLC